MGWARFNTNNCESGTMYKTKKQSFAYIIDGAVRTHAHARDGF